MKKKYSERQTLGRQAICPSEPAYYIVDCRIYDVTFSVILSTVPRSSGSGEVMGGKRSINIKMTRPSDIFSASFLILAYENISVLSFLSSSPPVRYINNKNE